MARSVVKVKMQTLRSGSNNQGFSLIEVMLVLALGALLMGVVATSLHTGPTFRQATREISTSLRQARAQALLHQQVVVWKMDTKAKHYWLEGNHVDKTDKTLATDIEAKINTAASEVYGLGQGGIRFFPDGSSTGGSVELLFKQQTVKINVEWITGRVSVQ